MLLCAQNLLVMRYSSLFAIASLGFAACGDSTPDASVEEDAAPVISIEAKTPGTDFPDAEITDVTYASGRFSYAYDSTSYQLGAQTPDAASTMCANSDKGQHIHLIIDNAPYIAKYEADFEQAVGDGEHYILSFLSRSYHESIKTAGAHRAVKATVADGAFASSEPITEPMLFYSRPKGEYVGKDAEELLLDFYPVNLELGDDYRVKVDIGTFTETLDEWQPYVIKGLPMGENTVTLTLVDGEGKRVEAPHNPVSRSFTLVADPMPAE